MSNNSDPTQYVNDLFFSQKIKDSSKIKNDLNIFSSENRPNTSRHNFKNTYEIQNYPNLMISKKLLNKDNNLNESSSQNDIIIKNKYNTFSNKYYTININNSLLNEQQSYSQIMKDNHDTSSHNNNGNTGKMSISELKDEKSINNQNKRNIYMNGSDNNSSDKKYFTHNNFAKNNYLKIDTGDELDLNLINKNNNNINNDNNDNNDEYNSNFNYNDIVKYNDNNDKEGDYNNEEIENIEENENENIEDNEDNENEILNDEEKKENKELEKFLIYNENKDKMSQNENNYILFGSNNSTNKDLNYDLLINKISQSNDNNQNNSKSFEHKRNFFSKIIDIEILIDTNEIYSKPWSQLINEIYFYLEQNNDSIQLISLGAQHTLCLSNQGKLFSFGWNNYSQCGIKNKSKIRF